MSQAVQYLAPNGEKINIVRAQRFAHRLVGLLCKQSMDYQEGLYFDRCNAVHTWGMRFDIDLVYLDKAGKIVEIVSALKPWRFNRNSKADSVLELAAGAAHKHK
ncbi:MAG: DUF192 domain-containing protein, partial [Granulosicoccaceae bacterium]